MGFAPLNPRGGSRTALGRVNHRLNGGGPEVRFARDSPLEESGFELLVPIAMARAHRGGSERYLSDDRQAVGDQMEAMPPAGWQWR